MNNLGRGSENQNKDKDRILTRETVGCVIVLFAAIALIVLITRTAIFGSVGGAISDFMLGVFGYCAYAVLAALVYAGIVLISGKKISAKKKTAALCLLAFVFLVCLVHTATSQAGGIDSRASYGGYLAACYRAGENSFFRTTGGGVIVGIIVYPVVRLTTYVGGYIIFSLLMAGSVYFIYSSRSKTAAEKKKRRQEEERMIASASQDTSGLYSYNYAEAPAPAQPTAEAYPQPSPAQPFAAPSAESPAQPADTSKRLYAVGSDFVFKSKKELRQDRRAEAVNRRREEEQQPQKPPLSPYAESRSVLYPDNAHYTNNLIFDSNSYFNNPNRGVITGSQYSENFRASSTAFSEGHERSNRTEPVRSAPASPDRPAAQETPRAAERPAAPANYSSMYSDAAESNITYANRPKKIVTDTTRPNDPTEADKPVSTYRADGGFYRKDVETAFSAGDGFSSERPVSSFTAPAAQETSAAPLRGTEPVSRGSEFTPRTETPVRGSEFTPRAETPVRGVSSEAQGEEPAGGEPFGARGRVSGFSDRDADAPETPSVQEPSMPRARRDEVRFMPKSDYEKEKEEEEERSTLKPITEEFDSAVNLYDDDEEETEGSVAEEAASRLGRAEEAASRLGGREELRAATVPERRQEAPAEPKKKHIYARYDAPPVSLLNDYQSLYATDGEEIERNKETIVDTLYQLKIPSDILSVTQGPTVTRYDIDIPGNIPTARVLGCDRELAMRLHAKDGVNIQTNYENGSISIEVPNKQKATVGLKELILSDGFEKSKPGALMFGMGKDIEGRSICGDIVKMKHLLVAGSTGSGKSVCLNSLIISLLYKYSPEDLRIILVDPKQVEFNIYDKLPHLMINEIIFEPNKVITVLNWAITEMERRYALFKAKTKSGTLVKEIDEYNAHLTEEEEKLPKIVMIIDELADLMQAAKKDIEDRIQRLTQKSRAAGIHLVLATQRPSTDVITGIIKSNLPTRIAFKVVQEVDSRTILDSSGAEKLLGYGDMLYKTDTMTFPYRLQGAFLSSEEVQNVVEYIKEHNEAYFDESVSDFINNSGSGGGESEGDGDDSVEAVYIDALRNAVLAGQTSISMIQRKCSVGYPKAGKIIEWMENMGYISAFEGAKARKVLLTQEEFDSKYGDYGN